MERMNFDTPTELKLAWGYPESTESNEELCILMETNWRAVSVFRRSPQAYIMQLGLWPDIRILAVQQL
jgi:hypothetical protein